MDKRVLLAEEKSQLSSNVASRLNSCGRSLTAQRITRLAEHQRAAGQATKGLQ